ncbi:MAG TPA: cytochrome C oxidase subunit IV family protein [Xanthobacteraceae bacterium]|jgi:cytochrome c oxidase subunit 4|nr:cytochrome C oxidase subunit IV family protein [Xanthobacteraceae bacterium]
MSHTFVIWRKNGLVWVGLLALLALTFGAAHLPLGGLNVVVGLAIAGIKVALVALVFMGLGCSPALMRLAAATGLFWLTLLFLLTLADVLAGRHAGNENSKGVKAEQSISPIR